MFSLVDPIDNIERYFAFQLRYYRSDVGGDDYNNTDNVASGAYIFKPAKDQQYSLPYVNVTKVENWNSSFVQQTTLYYSDTETNRSARAIIRAYEMNPTIQVEVLIHPIPASLGG